MSITLESTTPLTAAEASVEDPSSTRDAVAAFARVTAALEAPGGIDALLHVVADQVSRLVGVGRCSIHLWDETAGIFRGRVAQSKGSWMDEDIKRSLAGVEADGMTLELLETHRPVIVDNAPDDPRTVKSTVRFWRIRSIMAVPMLSQDEVVGVIFLDDEDRPHRFSAEDGAAATVFGGLTATAVKYAQKHAELRGRLDASQRQVGALRRATGVDERLSELLLQGVGLADLLGTLAALLGKPCAVFDPDGRRLAAAASDGLETGVLPRLLEPATATHPAMQAVLTANARNRTFVVGPLPEAGVLHRHVVASICLGEETWGRLVVMEHGTRFTGGDMLSLRRAATLIALQATMERRAVEADRDAGASLAAELLDGRSDVGLVRARAARMGIDLDRRRTVALLVARPDAGGPPPDARSLADALAQVAPGLRCQTTSVADGAAALIEVPDGIEDRAHEASVKDILERACARLGGPDAFVASLSSFCEAAAGLPGAYEEARQVTDCILQYSGADGPHVLSAEDLGAGRLFLATSDSDLVARFAEETFGDLATDRSKADLLTTICSFFVNMASIRRCALSLGLHENTIRYRLGRVEALTGLAVTHDPDAQLQARLSLLVLRLQGRLPDVASGEAFTTAPSE